MSNFISDMIRIVILCVLLFASMDAANAQRKNFPANKEENAMFEEAEFLISEEDFEKAFELYTKLNTLNPDQPIVYYRLGFCKQHTPGGDQEALEYYSKVDQAEMKGTEFPYYYALELHKNYKFQEAIDQMNAFLKDTKPSKEQKANALKTIKYCENGIELVRNPAAVTITTLGDPLNTQFSEYAPMISADEKTIVYTYRGEKSTGGLQPIPGSRQKDYNEDIQIAYKDSAGLWYEPLILQSNINTEGNDACVAITPDAQYIYMFRSIEDDPGSLYKSELDGMTWTDPELIKGDVNSKWWDGSITISHDGRKVYFASERPGGMGGRDIYEARLKGDGSWGKAKNIGSPVNTPLNDDAPFLHPSGKYLVFSSEGHNSMGGFDIFVSELKTDSTWDNPRNIGYPINSTNDDKFYTVTSDGKHGYYSSGKKGGLGKQDIYLVEPGIDRNVVLAQAIGDVLLDDYPIYSEIEVTDDLTTLVTKYNSNSISGKFLIPLPPGKLYKLKFTVGGIAPQEFQIDARNITGFEEKYLLVKFYSDPETAQHRKDSIEKARHTVDSLWNISHHHGKDSLVANNTSTTTNTNNTVDHNNNTNTSNNTTIDNTNNSNNNTNNNNTNNNNTNNNTTETKIMPMAELLELSHPDLVYRVQVGAYRFPENFRVEKFERDEKSVKQTLNDGITRFTIKQFQTLKEAYAYRDEMIKLGVNDAFVTAVFKGKRYLLTDIRPELMKALQWEPK